MKTLSFTSTSTGRRTARATFLALASFILMPLFARAADDTPALLDDFTDETNRPGGIARIVVNDASVGGTSLITQTFADGVLKAEGEIIPGRGQPGWVTVVLLLSTDGKPVDVSRYEGIRLRVRVRKGNFAISANSTEVTNFDYHASVVPRTPGDIQEVRLPFKDMKRAWSEQTPLNRATVASVSLTAIDFQKGAFAYDIDEIGFY